MTGAAPSRENSGGSRYHTIPWDRLSFIFGSVPRVVNVNAAQLLEQLRQMNFGKRVLAVILNK